MSKTQEPPAEIVRDGLVDIKIEGTRATAIRRVAGVEECEVFDIPDMTPGTRRLVVVKVGWTREQWQILAHAMGEHLGGGVAFVLIDPDDKLDIYDLSTTNES